MRGIRKIWLLSMLVAAAVFVQNAAAEPVLFDFEDLSRADDQTAIEAYMEDVYGSDITVTNGIVGNGIIPGCLGDDHYIQAGPNYGMYWFAFSFNEVPITTVSFDWAVELNAFHAFADDVEFFSEGWWSSGSSGTISFDSPVTTLKFTDSNVWEIEVDNLAVTPLPKPATVSMLGIGGALMTLTRKR